MLDAERKFIKLSILGILANRIRMGNEYTTVVPNNKSIIEFFRDTENCTVLDIENWTEKYNKKILRIRSLANKERIEGFKSRENFLQWYLDVEKQCCYCGVCEKDLSKYFHSENKQYVNARQRGQYLEIERVVSAPKSKNVYTPENTKLACYICNNAKSDFLSVKDFRPIACGINSFWEAKLGKKIDFPQEVYNTFSE